MYTNILSKYYDELMDDYSNIVTTVKKLLREHTPPDSKILELGCGTGNILQMLQQDYQIHGLDNSSAMLDIAKTKLPQATYYHIDMTTFSIPQKFNAIFAVFDTINHLLTLSKWKKVFAKVQKHLTVDGVFIFDINTKTRLEKLVRYPHYIKKLNENTLCCSKVTYTGKQKYTIKFQIFENIKSNKIYYAEESVSEATFELNTIQQALKEYFKTVTLLDPQKDQVTKESTRVFFICKQN